MFGPRIKSRGVFNVARGGLSSNDQSQPILDPARPNNEGDAGRAPPQALSRLRSRLWPWPPVPLERFRLQSPLFLSWAANLCAVPEYREADRHEASG